MVPIMLFRSLPEGDGSGSGSRICTYCGTISQFLSTETSGNILSLKKKNKQKKEANWFPESPIAFTP